MVDHTRRIALPRSSVLLRPSQSPSHTAYRATKVLRASSSITIPASTTADASPISPTSSVAARQTSPENAATSASPPGFHASTAFCVRLFRPFVFNCSLYCNPTPTGYRVRVRSLCVLQCGSRVVSVLDSGAEGPGFKSQPRRRRVKAKFHYTDPTRTRHGQSPRTLSSTS